jgi:molybdate transport system substrate-binding protein
VPGLRQLAAGLAAAIVCSAAVPVRAQVAVAAASDLQAVLPEVAARFQQSTGQAVRISYGSSGQFAAQIQNGAPFDVFLSADEAYVERLVDSGHAVRGSIVQYAFGRLALWTRTDRGVDISGGLRALGNARVRRIAIANPEHAPYGRAAVAALRNAGLYDQVRARLVLGENISQAAQFAQTGNADAGLIALSLTRTAAMQRVGRAVELPSDTYPPIRQTGVLLMRATANRTARAFLDYMTSPETAALLRSSGFGVQP